MAGNRLSNTDSLDAGLVQEVVGGPVLSWLQTYHALSGSDAYCGYEFRYPREDDRFAYWYTPFYELPTYTSFSRVLRPDATVPDGDFPGRYESALGIQTVADVKTYVAGVPASGDPLSSSFVNAALDRLETLDRFLLTSTPPMSSVLSRTATNTDRGTTGTTSVRVQVGETSCSGATGGDDDYDCENVSRSCTTPVETPLSMSPYGQHDDTGQETSDYLFYANYGFYAGKSSTFDQYQTYESHSGNACYGPNYDMTSVYTEQTDFASAQYGNVESADFEPPATIDVPLVDAWPSCAPTPALVSAWLIVRRVYASAKRTWSARLNHYNRPDPDASRWQYTTSVPSDERPFADADVRLANNVDVLVKVQGSLVVSGGALKLRVSGGTSLRARVLDAAGVTLPPWAANCVGATSESSSPAIVSERPGVPAMELPALAKDQQGFSMTSTGHVTWDGQTDSCSGPTDWYTGHVDVSARVQLSARLDGAVVVLEKGEPS